MGLLLPRALSDHLGRLGQLGRRHSRVLFWTAWLASGLAVAWVLTVIWWALLDPSGRPRIEELVIPNGTAAAIAAGGPAPFIPNQISLGPNAELRVRNLDIVEHRVATRLVPPGGVAVITAAPGSDQLVCTVHPSGYVGLTIEERPAITSTILPAILLGLPVGIAFGLASWIAKRLSMDDGGPLPPAPGQGPPTA